MKFSICGKGGSGKGKGKRKSTIVTMLTQELNGGFYDNDWY